MSPRASQPSPWRERVDALRARLHALYVEAGGHPDYRAVDPLHHELSELMAERDDVVTPAETPQEGGPL